MAKYDHGGGCPCGLYKECKPSCEWHPQSTHSVRKIEKLTEQLIFNDQLSEWDRKKIRSEIQELKKRR